MNETLSVAGMAPEQDQRISEVVKLERARLRNFIRRRVPDERDAEDMPQDVFYELLEAYRRRSTANSEIVKPRAAPRKTSEEKWA